VFFERQIVEKEHRVILGRNWGKLIAVADGANILSGQLDFEEERFEFSALEKEN
jgi:hypothetical protein